MEKKKIKNLVIYGTTLVLLTGAISFSVINMNNDKNITSSTISQSASSLVSTYSSSETTTSVPSSSTSSEKPTESSNPSSNTSSKPASTPSSKPSSSTPSSKPTDNIDQAEINSIVDKIYNQIKDDRNGKMITKTSIREIIECVNGITTPPLQRAVNNLALLSSIDFALVRTKIIGEGTDEVRTKFSIDDLFLSSIRPADKAFINSYWQLRERIYDAVSEGKTSDEISNLIVETFTTVDNFVKKGTNIGNNSYSQISNSNKLIILHEAVNFAALLKEIEKIKNINYNAQQLLDEYDQKYIQIFDKMTTGNNATAMLIEPGNQKHL